MNIEKTIQEDRQAKLVVEYTNEEFEGFKHRAARRISKDTKIPGFRPGKAPYNVILNRYGEAAILQEAVDILLDDDYGKMLEQAEIEPSGSGSLESIESYDPPKFVFIVPLEPEIDLGDYREIRKDYQLEPFDEIKVDEFIANLQRNAATIVPAEHPAEESNLVYFNLSGEFLNPGEDEDATITDKTPQQVVIPTEAEVSETEWPFSGFARELIGAKAGETREIQHTYPDDAADEDFRGKTAIFTIEVQSVKELELPEIDEEFVQSMGDYESPEAFRASIDAQMRVDHQEKYDAEYFNAVLSEIIENAKIVYPPQMLEHEEEHALQDVKSRLGSQNLDFETYLNLRGMDEATFIEQEVRPAAKQRLERSLVVDALIEAEELKLDQDLLTQNINQVLNEVFYSGNVQELQKQMGKEEFSQAISMEGFQRTLVSQLQERLKLIATGKPIPAEGEDVEPESESELELETESETETEETPVEEPEKEPETAPADEEQEEPVED